MRIPDITPRWRNQLEYVGPGVVYVRWAITDLYLKKKKRGILSYTPVDLVVHTTAQAAIRDMWRKIDIVELNIEGRIDSIHSIQNGDESGKT